MKNFGFNLYQNKSLNFFYRYPSFVKLPSCVGIVFFEQYC